MTTVTPENTATTRGAREHARAQANQRVAGMPTVPADQWTELPGGVPAEAMTWAETIPGGRYTVKTLRRGTRVRLTDITGTACASLALWRVDAPWERLCLPDTVKIPWQAYLGTDHPLLSDQGRVLATIVADSSAHHDALCGTTTLASNTAKYGDGSVHSDSPAGRELMLLAAAKSGLGPSDVAPTISLFQGVRVETDGALTFIGSAGAGAAVELVLHLDCIVAVANTAHPLDPSPTFDTGMVELLAWTADADLRELIDRGDTTPEFRRAVANSEDAHRASN